MLIIFTFREYNGHERVFYAHFFMCDSEEI
jgi:hypothetical protein